MYDVIILGGGPAGVSASLYCKRANKSVLMIYSEDSGLLKAHKIDNYYGFENGISGEELYNAGINQAKNIGVDTAKEEVIKIEPENETFKVITDKKTYESKSIILAFGAKKNTLKIDGIKELEGKGISYCAICDGFFYRNKDVAVIGSGNYAISETNDLIKQDGPTDTQYFVKDFKEIKVYRDEYGNKRVQTRTMVNIVGIILFTVCNYYMIKEIFSKEPVYIINQTGDTVIDFIQMIFPAVVTPIFVAVEIWLIIDLWKYLKERKVRDTMQKKKLGMKQIIYRIYVAIFCILFGTMSIGAFVNSDILPIVGIMIKYLFTPLVILAILFFIFTVIDDIRKL